MGLSHELGEDMQSWKGRASLGRIQHSKQVYTRNGLKNTIRESQGEHTAGKREPQALSKWPCKAETEMYGIKESN